MEQKFDPNKSPLRDVYRKYEVKHYFDLDDKYMEEDQRLMYAASWDYKNKKLLPNKIRLAIEKVGIENITDKEEKYWIQNMLWMWYHHAISCAVWRYGDKNAALKYSEKALELQPVPHPNKITKLLYHLVRDDLEAAEAHAKTIDTEPEKSTAQYTLEEYKRGDFFKQLAA